MFEQSIFPLNNFILNFFNLKNIPSEKPKSVALTAILLFFVNLPFLPNLAAQQNSGKRPNIVFIMTDDHAFQAISAYEDDLIQTPNIDRIAEEGALMEQAFVTNSICGPSRAVILTGQYSHLNGVKGNQERFDGDQLTLPKILKNNGYRTALIGKWHLKSQPTGFDYWNTLPGQGDYYHPRFEKMGKDTIYKGYVTDVITDESLRWIDLNKDKKEPFFIMVHHKAPHRNQMPPIENLELFNDRDFAFPASFFDEFKDQPALRRQNISMISDLYVDFDNKVPCDSCKVKRGGKWKPRAYKREVGRLNKEEKKAWEEAYEEEYEKYARLQTKDQLIKWQFQRYMEDFLRTVKSVDDNVGRILDYLEKTGLEENTIVVYTSDQGAFLGEHGLYDKRFMYEEAFRTPMMVRYPREIKDNQHLDEMVLNLDIAPTLLDFAGIGPPKQMQGKSMKTILTNTHRGTWRDKIYYHYYQDSYGITPHYGIRTNRYKLIRFYGPLDYWELYDLKKDSTEVNNLYGDPKYADLVDSLKKELKGLRTKYKDTSGPEIF